jgi:hypothetical protein
VLAEAYHFHFEHVLCHFSQAERVFDVFDACIPDYTLQLSVAWTFDDIATPAWRQLSGLMCV